MPHFCALLDPDPVRRASFEATALRTFTQLQDDGDTCRQGDFLLLHSTRPTLPYAIHAHADGLTCVASTSEQGSALLARNAHADFGDFLHYGVALRFSEPNHITVQTERFGLFPLFYWQNQSVALCATSPSFFLLHPLFRKTLNWLGLVKTLRFAYGAHETTLWQDVYRAPQSATLHWNSGRGWTIERHPWPASAPEYRSLPEAAEALLPALRKAVKMPAGRPVYQTLSGGLDSRLLAGLLQERFGSQFHALTLGDEADQEYQIAHTVARALRIPHTRVPIPIEKFPAWMRLQMDNCHGSLGLTSFGNWSLTALPQLAEAALSTGLVGEHTIADTYAPECWNNSTQSIETGRLWEHLYVYGLPAQEIRKLLRIPYIDDLLAQSEADLVAELNSYEGSPHTRLKRFCWNHRPRYHLAKEAWRWAHAGLLNLPFIHADVLQASLPLSPACLDSRNLETFLVTNSFAPLARLPLDRNSLFIRPLLVDSLPARLHWAIRQRLYNRLRNRTLGTAQERLYYYRFSSLNHNPAWRQLRQQARTAAPGLADYFDPTVVERLLPPPEVEVPAGESISGASGRKTLIGLLLCLERFAPSR